ncbi:response regulator [Haliangium ochraceum]|uniref:Response regulator receiver protein n=1 Tax=Haliangium ochraceum (strain DSM 14365 / JCM 11303 / SMP-2) TaxID=502025 RepID=D0LQ94_HALO1|nr:response regulator [Haliangium ochraceum]ACY18903.1 response regulator receiver protein [Haliangium ochraceum DSM 14365]
MPASPTASILLVHDDPALLDALTRSFEERGFDVRIAATEFVAQTHLSSDAVIGAVIAGWDAGHLLGRAIYSWVLDHRYELRARFVFVASAPPPGFDELVQGRCLLMRPGDRGEIVHLGASLAEQAAAESATQGAANGAAGDDGQPSLLLIEDDPLQLDCMQMLLGELHYRITSVESRQAAVDALQRSDFDVILSDWYMADGSGAELRDWLQHHRPHLATRCVFMSASLSSRDGKQLAPDTKVLPKGQDADSLLAELRGVVERVRGDAIEPPQSP